MALKFLRQLYSLDTLDTRFVVPATAPPKEALEEAKLDPAAPLPVQSGRAKNKNGGDNVQPSRWTTPEFYFYYVVILICLALMFKAVLDVSKGLPKCRTNPWNQLLIGAQCHIRTTPNSHIC